MQAKIRPEVSHGQAVGGRGIGISREAFDHPLVFFASFSHGAP